MAEVRTPRCSETIDLEECLAAKAGAGDHGTLGAALAYAERGWAVFPCQGKHPLTKHGCKDATTDAAALRRLWQRFPPPNIGLATGKASGIWVLDVDGPAGEATLAELEAPMGHCPGPSWPGPAVAAGTCCSATTVS